MVVVDLERALLAESDNGWGSDAAAVDVGGDEGGEVGVGDDLGLD